jgi:hypothetical protein
MSEDGDDKQGALEWKSDEIESLIETVRSRKILYDIISKDNKNAGKKELEWLNVSELLGKDGMAHSSYKNVNLILMIKR